MDKKNLRRKIKITTTLLLIMLILFGLFGVAGILFAEDGFQEIVAASILGAFTFILIVATIPVVGSYIKGITTSVKTISDVVENLEKYGQIDDNSEEYKKLLLESKREDQFGELAKSFIGMMDSIIRNIQTMQVIATGDLTIRAELVSEKDSLGIAINTIIESLNLMLDDIRKTSDQLNMGIIQFSSASQTLAQSTSEQSATIEQLLLSVKEITEKSTENTSRSMQAAELSGNIKENAQGGHEQMTKMTLAMDDINSASQSISTVMKAIDDIAFQTNILSLNAAVEAARAGQHGKGFAVVADEVRNLATKSATAASDSNEMISNTLKKSKLGSEIVKDTSESLDTILSGIKNSASLIDEIAASTQAQSKAIDEINNGINQFSNVVYQNSATAEQSAAASDEMSLQTSELLKLVDKFIIDESFVSSTSKKGSAIGIGSDHSTTIDLNMKEASSSISSDSYHTDANQSDANQWNSSDYSAQGPSYYFDTSSVKDSSIDSDTSFESKSSLESDTSSKFGNIGEKDSINESSVQEENTVAGIQFTSTTEAPFGNESNEKEVFIDDESSKY